MNEFAIMGLVAFGLLLTGCTSNVDVNNASVNQDTDNSPGQTVILQCQTELNTCTTRCSEGPGDREVCKTQCQRSYTTCAA